MADYPPRPQTPQAVLHRLPDKPEVPSKENAKPTKFMILLMVPPTLAGKVQIAKSISAALSVPFFDGDSLHKTASRAAEVGAQTTASGANETRYQRMWLSKMTRTGHLFPDESRAANDGFSGFGGRASSSASTSRRGSDSSVASDAAVSTPSSVASSFMSSGLPASTKYINKPPVFTLSEDEKLRKANPALVVVTHPCLEKWHRQSIRNAVGEYGIGVIFVPLYERDREEEDELPILRPLDPMTMTSFGSFGAFGAARKQVNRAWEEEIVLEVDEKAKIEDLVEDIVDGVRGIMNE